MLSSAQSASKPYGGHEMKAKLVVTFPGKTLQLIEKGRSIYAAIRSQSWFKDASPELTALVEQLAEKLIAVKNAYDEAATRDSNKIAFRKQQEAALRTLLVQISRYVENMAQGDENILLSSGFDLARKKTRRIDYPLLAALIALRHGKDSGTILVKGRRLPGAWRYETCITDDPAGQDGWQLVHDTRTCSHLIVPGVTPGAVYCVRMRGIWPAGPGPWSVVATIRAL